jgi:hypothetical protein
MKVTVIIMKAYEFDSVFIYVETVTPSEITGNFFLKMKHSGVAGRYLPVMPSFVFIGKLLR